MAVQVYTQCVFKWGAKVKAILIQCERDTVLNKVGRIQGEISHGVDVGKGVFL